MSRCVHYEAIQTNSLCESGHRPCTCWTAATIEAVVILYRSFFKRLYLMHLWDIKTTNTKMGREKSHNEKLFHWNNPVRRWVTSGKVVAIRHTLGCLVVAGNSILVCQMSRVEGNKTLSLPRLLWRLEWEFCLPHPKQKHQSWHCFECVLRVAQIIVE